MRAAATGKEVWLPGFGRVQVFGIATPDGGTAYWAANDPGMTDRTRRQWAELSWAIETTFQESRCGLGPESTRGWCRKTVLRAGPCLLGLYTFVAVLFHAPPESERAGAVAWPGKATVTFSDALCAVRRWL